MRSESDIRRMFDTVVDMTADEFYGCLRANTQGCHAKDVALGVFDFVFGIGDDLSGIDMCERRRGPRDRRGKTT